MVLVNGLWLENQKLALRNDLADPEPAAGESLVRVTLSGICNTDLELCRGYYPFRGVLGHEFVGVVDASPDLSMVGRRVVGEINAVCHNCSTCNAGRTTHCENRTVLGIVGRDGAHADFLVLPTENLHVVPDSVSDDCAVFAEPLAAALQIKQQIDIRKADRVLVVGDGKLGLLIAQTLAATDCDLLVLGRHESKLETLAVRGIATTTRPDEIDDRSIDVAVECTGNRSGFEVARKAVRPRGTIVMKSTYAAEMTMNVAALVVDEITLIGSRCGPFAPALAMLETGAIDVVPMIHARYALDEALEAFEKTAEPGVLKVVLDRYA